MKKGIHPQVNLINAHCTCGSTFVTKSTLKDISTTLCSQCHPFFTGNQKLVDAAGRIDKFNKKYGSSVK